jgi:NAD(P)-dependent dehydrogenase (short-subunit alcohol dehydrogenase family)
VAAGVFDGRRDEGRTPDRRPTGGARHRSRPRPRPRGRPPAGRRPRRRAHRPHAGRAAGAAAALGVRALPVGLDVGDPASVAAAVDAVAADPGRLDVLVNNAAAHVDWSETGAGADLDAARTVMEINLFGAWRMVQAALPLLRRSPHPGSSTSAAAPARTATPPSA